MSRLVGFLLSLIFAISALHGVAPQADAGVIALGSYGFQSVSNNKEADVKIGESQVFVEVFGWNGSAMTSSGTDTSVLFRFRNEGPESASITQIYFENGYGLQTTKKKGKGRKKYNSDPGPLDSLDHLIFESGVEFTPDANPGNLPSANSADPAFKVTDGLLASPTSPTSVNGINPGEYLSVVFSLDETLEVNDVIDALELALQTSPTFVNDGDPTTNTLRIGVRVQDFIGGGSEAFINRGSVQPIAAPSPAPEPSSLSILACLLVTTAMRRRRVTPSR